MLIAFEDLNWIHYNQGKLSNRITDNVFYDSDYCNEELSVNCYQETLQVDNGFVLVRSILNTGIPIQYDTVSGDYIGLCYTFADSHVDVSKVAFPHLYHNKLNITNGYEYGKSTHHLVNCNTYYFSLQFTKKFLNEMNNSDALPHWLMRLVDGEKGQLSTVEIPAHMRQLAWKILQFPRYPQMSCSDKLSMQASALHWLAKIIETPTMKHTHQQNSPSRLLDLNTIQQACKIIEHNFCQPINSNELANRLGTNECYLKQAFRSQTGKSIHQYLTDYRLTRASQLVQQKPSLSISHIASICGYQPSHFSQIFRKQFGVTPKDYRTQCKK